LVRDRRLRTFRAGGSSTPSATRLAFSASSTGAARTNVVTGEAQCRIPKWLRVTVIERRCVKLAQPRAFFIVSDIVRAYETDDERFVVVEDEELAALEPDKSRDIDLLRLVPRDDIPLAYVERSYFLVPSGRSNKAYRLLAATMEKSRLAGIATFVMRGHEYLVAINADGGVLRAQTLRFGDEIRSPSDIGLPEVSKAPAAKLASWKKLVSSHSRKAIPAAALEQPEADELRRLAEDKLARGEDVIEAGEEERETPDRDVIDLMKVLKERLAGGPKKAKPRGNGAAARASLDGSTKEELYERAKELGIEGRSKMTKRQLMAAIAKSA
jgi:DNA end-binding protein Ku